MFTNTTPTKFIPSFFFFFYENAGKGLCKSYESNAFLLKRNPQHKCQQNLQVHNGQALQLAVDGGKKLDCWRAHN